MPQVNEVASQPSTGTAKAPATTTQTATPKKAVKPKKTSNQTAVKPRSVAAKKTTGTPQSAKPAKTAVSRAAPAKVKPKSPASKPVKQKVVRDSFTFPKDEYQQLDDLKARVLALGLSAKKGELLRSGLRLLTKASDAQLRAALAAVPKIKTGRPKD